MILPGVCGLAKLDQPIVSRCVAGGAEQLRCVAGLGASLDEVASCRWTVARSVRNTARCCAHVDASGFPAGRATVRPAACSSVVVAERRCAGDGGRCSCRAQRGGAPERLRGMPRRRGRRSERPGLGGADSCQTDPGSGPVPGGDGLDCGTAAGRMTTRSGRLRQIRR